MASKKRIYEAKKACARHHAPHVQTHCFRNSGVTDRSDNQLVVIHPYDPATEIAAQQVGMAYGSIYVAGCSESTRSHELNELGDGSGFIPRKQLNEEREQRRAFMVENSIV